MNLLRRTRRLKAEGGFTMIVALGVMLVVSLLCAAAFVAVDGDARLTNDDLQGKQAYAAAQTAVQAYLYNLNENSSADWWENCPNDNASSVAVPGQPANVTYSWAPVVSCSSSQLPGTLIDANGNIAMRFTGTVTTGSAQTATRTIVADFHTQTPLSYLWYTVHETLDPAADSNCDNDPFYYNQTSNTQIPQECQINWTSGDTLNGNLYTQDQLLIQPGTDPSFNGSITSQGPTAFVNNDPENASCGGSPCKTSNGTIQGAQTTGQGAQPVQFPTDNSNLVNDATKYGPPPGPYTGTIDVELEGSSALVYNCPGPSANSACSGPQTVNLSQYHIMYAQNGSGCNSSYSPDDVSYSLSSNEYGGLYLPYGPCGDIYVIGAYSQSLTLAAQNDIIIVPCTAQSSTTTPECSSVGNVSGVVNTSDTNPSGTSSPTGGATLGLVADQYVRVWHPATINGTCQSFSAPNPNVTIDAAILTLQHSFMVDNFGCGSAAMGKLTVHGAIAQYYRGAVGAYVYNSSSNAFDESGYLKNYNYDSRLAAILPPYLFDLQSTNWTVLRETLCGPTISGNCTGSS